MRSNELHSLYQDVSQNFDHYLEVENRFKESSDVFEQRALLRELESSKSIWKEALNKFRSHLDQWKGKPNP